MRIDVIVLTYNEESNMQACLTSVKGWAQDVFVVDNGSTDRTQRLSEDLGARFYRHTWSHIADQRNWALDNLPLTSDWTMFVDADERVTPELKHEIEHAAANSGLEIGGLAIRQDFHFLGRALRHVHTGSALIRIVRTGRGRWQKTIGTDERCIVDGKVLCLANRLVHLDYKGLSHWIAKHDWYATERAKDLLARKQVGWPLEDANTEANLNWYAKTKWIMRHRVPVSWRPFFYFVYTYIIQLGFLDGSAGFAYAFLHELWFNLLVNWKIAELTVTRPPQPRPADAAEPARGTVTPNPQV